MDPNKLTSASRETLNRAIQIALDGQNPTLDPLHLLLALVIEADSVPVQIMNRANVDLPQLLHLIHSKVDALLTGEVSATQIRPDPKLLAVFSSAEKEARKKGDSFISQEVLLLALYLTECQASDILKQFLSIDTMEKSIEQVRGGVKVQDQSAENKYQVIEKYMVNLTKLAREGNGRAKKVLDYVRERVRDTTGTVPKYRQRVRWWACLILVRNTCPMTNSHLTLISLLIPWTTFWQLVQTAKPITYLSHLKMRI